MSWPAFAPVTFALSSATFAQHFPLDAASSRALRAALVCVSHPSHWDARRPVTEANCRPEAQISVRLS